MAPAPGTMGDLQRAIRAGELSLVYQPEVDLRTGHIAAVEALVRWHRPEIGVVLPSEFVPLAERTGAIRELSVLVLKSALTQAARWSSARWDGHALPVWVNLSARDLMDPALPTQISEAIEESGALPGQLGIEITETARIEDLKLAVTTLWELHAAGIRIALDDFGTGYSSLTHLKSLPVDVVKIDRSFVEGVAHDRHDAAIGAAIIGVAHALEQIVVAEGIEDSVQHQALDGLGCDLGQGYRFASPQPARCLDILLAADRQLASSPRPTRAMQTTQIRLPQPRGVFADTCAGWATL